MTTVTLIKGATYTIGGVTFVKGKPRTDISAGLANKLAESKHFQVKFDAPAAAPAPAQEPEPEASTEAQGDGKTKLVISGGKAQVKASDADEKSKEGAVTA